MFVDDVSGIPMENRLEMRPFFSGECHVQLCSSTILILDILVEMTGAHWGRLHPQAVENDTTTRCSPPNDVNFGLDSPHEVVRYIYHKP